mmetsp:Transcript_16220/g.27974  ORF Transcript_16220/g.27974 Transcript_16220/m.27974 type:complete len:181 (-) Transcript_16220:1571-2113(-)
MRTQQQIRLQQQPQQLDPGWKRCYTSTISHHFQGNEVSRSTQQFGWSCATTLQFWHQRAVYRTWYDMPQARASRPQRGSIPCDRSRQASRQRPCMGALRNRPYCQKDLSTLAIAYIVYCFVFWVVEVHKMNLGADVTRIWEYRSDDRCVDCVKIVLRHNPYTKSISLSVGGVAQPGLQFP